MRYKSFQTFFVFAAVLLVPGIALAHEGISSREWLGHVLSSPLAAPDHILATLATAAGLLMLFWNQASKIMRYTGAIIALAGLSLFLV